MTVNSDLEQLGAFCPPACGNPARCCGPRRGGRKERQRAGGRQRDPLLYSIPDSISSSSDSSSTLLHDRVAREALFHDVLTGLKKEREDSLPQLLGLSRATMDTMMGMERTLVRQLLKD